MLGFLWPLHSSEGLLLGNTDGRLRKRESDPLGQRQSEAERE